MSAAHTDPDGFALLLVQQFLSEHGYTTALSALEAQAGLRYSSFTLPRRSQLLELAYAHLEAQFCSDSDAEQEQPGGTKAAAPGSSRHDRDQLQHTNLEEELAPRGDVAYPNHLLCRLAPPCSANLLCLQLWPGAPLVVTGAADGTIMLLRYEEPAAAAAASDSAGGEPPAPHSMVWQTRLAGAGGVLCLAWHPAIQSGSLSFEDCVGSTGPPPSGALLLAGCMDGSVRVLSAVTGLEAASARPHTKYVVAAVWAPEQQHHHQGFGGQFIATASYDCSCCLLRLSGGTTGVSASQHLQLIRQVPLDGCVHDVCWLPPGAAGPAPTASSTQASEPSSSSDALLHAAAAADSGADTSSSLGTVVVATRGSSCLMLLDVRLQAEDEGTAVTAVAAAAAGSVNLSEADDGHVSFSGLRLALSPCCRLLLVATDSPAGIHLVLRLADWGVVRRLYCTEACGQFHNASLAWHSDSSCVFIGSSHAPPTVLVCHVSTAKVVARLDGHRVNVRSLCYDLSTNRLASCSFDKTIRVWDRA